jgi:hypothetical protein
MNLLPVQAYFNADGTFNTFVGQGQPFTVPFSGTFTSAVITSSTINSTTIGATTPSTGAFTSLSSTADATIHGLTIGLGSGSVATNTVLGANALSSNTTGASNVALGFQSLFSNTTANNNTAVGYQAGYLVTTGSKNTILGGYSGNQGGLDIRTASNYIVLSDGAGNPRLFSDGSGNIAIGGTTTGLNNFNNISFNNANDGWASVNHISGSGSGLAYFYFGYAGGVVGSISQSGTTAVLYNVTSDQRLKTNIVDAPAGNIDSIKVRSFDWITDNTHQTYGMVAQELLEVAPYAVHQPVDKEEMMAVDYSKLVPMMIKEIQDLKAKVASLGAK